MSGSGEDDGRDLLEVSDRILRGLVDPREARPPTPAPERCEVAPGTAFVTGFSNVTAFATDDGLVLIDASSRPYAERIRSRCARWSSDPVHTLVYSHGHLDHIHGTSGFESERAAGGGSMRVIAHDRVPSGSTVPRSAVQAGRQPPPVRGTSRLTSGRLDYRYPDETYRDVLALTSATAVRAPPRKGETDDHTWTWLPAPTRAVPRRPVHLGLPQRRQPAEGAALPAGVGRALREMAALGRRSCCCPATACRSPAPTGSPQALTTPPTCSSRCVDQTVALMNDGRDARRDPPHGRGRRRTCSTGPTCGRVYDEPEFVVRNVLAALRRLVRRQPGAPEAGARGRAGRRGRGAGRRRGPAGGAGPARSPTPATCDWPATSPSWPPWPIRRRPSRTALGRRRSGRWRSRHGRSWPGASSGPRRETPERGRPERSASEVCFAWPPVRWGPWRAPGGTGSMIDLSLEGKVAIVTGGSKGHRPGDRADLRRGGGPGRPGRPRGRGSGRRGAGRSSRAAGRRSAVQPTSPIARRSTTWSRRTVDAFGTVDILVNNAGAAPFLSTLDQTAPAGLREVLPDQLLLRRVLHESRGADPAGATVGVRAEHGVGGRARRHSRPRVLRRRPRRR